MNNILKAELKHKFFTTNKVEEFNVNIDNLNLKIWNRLDVLYIEVIGNNKNKDELVELLGEIFSLIFLYLGSFPNIVKIKNNDNDIDKSKLVNKFNTQEYFIKNNSVLCKINDDTINQEKLNYFRKLNQKLIGSMEYLISDVYKSIMIEHKFTLLLHIIDGVIPDNVIKSSKEEISEKYSINYDIGEYKPKVYYLCKNNFFDYCKRYNFKILESLNLDEWKFIESISYTRHWYSHFLSEKSKQSRLKDTEEMVVCFEFIYYIIRVYMLKEIFKINIEEEILKDYFYSIQNWILQIKIDNKIKSKLYK